MVLKRKILTLRAQQFLSQRRVDMAQETFGDGQDVNTSTLEASTSRQDSIHSGPQGLDACSAVSKLDVNISKLAQDILKNIYISLAPLWHDELQIPSFKSSSSCQDDLDSNLDPSSTIPACEVQKKKKRKKRNKKEKKDIQMRCAETIEQPMRKVYPPPDIKYGCCGICKFRTYETDLYWRPAQAYGYQCLCQSCYYGILAKSEKDKASSSELCIDTAHGRLTLSAVYSQVHQLRSFLDDPAIANPYADAHDAQANEWMSRKMHELLHPLIPKIEIIRNVLSRLLQKRGDTDAAINEDLITLREMHKKFEAVQSDMYRTLHDHYVNGHLA